MRWEAKLTLSLAYPLSGVIIRCRCADSCARRQSAVARWPHGLHGTLRLRYDGCRTALRVCTAELACWLVQFVPRRLAPLRSPRASRWLHGSRGRGGCTCHRSFGSRRAPAPEGPPRSSSRSSRRFSEWAPSSASVGARGGTPWAPSPTPSESTARPSTWPSSTRHSRTTRTRCRCMGDPKAIRPVSAPCNWPS